MFAAASSSVTSFASYSVGSDPTIGAALGRDVLDKGLQAYFSDWKFRHPTPDDFKHELEKASGKKLDSLFSMLDKEGKL